jgi:hypothetical protein
MEFCGEIKMKPKKIGRIIYGVICPNFGTVPIPGSIIITDKNDQKIIPSIASDDGELIFSGEVYKKYKNQKLSIIFLEDDDINSLSISDLDSKDAIRKSLRNIETLSNLLYQRRMYSKYKGANFKTWIISNQVAISNGKIIFFEKSNDDFPGLCDLEEWCLMNRPFIQTFSFFITFKVCESCKQEFTIYDVLKANIEMTRQGRFKHKHC